MLILIEAKRSNFEGKRLPATMIEKWPSENYFSLFILLGGGEKAVLTSLFLLRVCICVLSLSLFLSLSI